MDESRSSNKYSTYIPAPVIRDKFGIRYNPLKDVTELVQKEAERETKALIQTTAPEIEDELFLEGVNTLGMETSEFEGMAEELREISSLFSTKSKEYSTEGGENRLEDKLC